MRRAIVIAALVSGVLVALKYAGVGACLATSEGWGEMGCGVLIGLPYAFLFGKFFGALGAGAVFTLVPLLDFLCTAVLVFAIFALKMRLSRKQAE